MNDRHVTTTAELDGMTPAERQRHFEDSIVPPEHLPPEQHEKIIERQDQLIAQREQRAS